MAISLRKVNREHSRALMRLTLRVMGEGQRVFNDFGSWLIDLVKGEVGEDGLVNGLALLQLMPQIERRWKATIEEWLSIFEKGREQAATLPFGVLAVQHNAYMPPVAKVQEDLTRTQLDSAIALWQGRRQRALEATRTRILGDGLSLSQRVWRLQQGGLQAIRNTLMVAMDGRTNAVDLARLLESELGINQDLPRWTLSRLYRMTPSERAANRRGLLRDPQDRQRGISYNALRLARTELQFANHAMSTEIARHAPWVTGRKVRLSPGHPRVDICDSYAAGGPYEKDDEILPLHPNCVTPGQVVKTKRGDKQIEDISAGDEVLTHTSAYKRVTKMWNRRYEGEVFKIITSQGAIELTGDHPVLLRRGWIDAQFVQPGDEVLYALSGIGSDSFSVKSEHFPAPLGQPCITGTVMRNILLMPSAVTLDSNLETRKGNIDEVTPDLMLPGVKDTSLVKSGQHEGFEAARFGESLVSVGKQHGQQSWITATLGERDFLGNFGALGVINPVLPNNGFSKSFASSERASTIIFAPSNTDGITASAHGDAVGVQEFSQHAVGNTKAAKNFGRFELLDKVNLLKKFYNRFLELRFDTKCVEFVPGDSVLDEVGTCDALHLQSTDGASNHNNLLSLSPDVTKGAESGNSVVGEVANPAQARMNYSIVISTEQRFYSGPVYNMAVEDDNSYTVNGAAVHNCMCYYEDVLMPADEFTRNVREWLGGQNSFLDDYESWLGIQPVTEPLTAALSLVEVLEFWLGISSDGHGAALGLQ